MEYTADQTGRLQGGLGAFWSSESKRIPMAEQNTEGRYWDFWIPFGESLLVTIVADLEDSKVFKEEANQIILFFNHFFLSTKHNLFI